MKRRRRSNADKWALAARDGLVCYLCGETSTPDDPLEVDHVIPLAREGADDLRNKRLAHASCNRRKGCE
jgi:5-methylcytosine-specific restriction endonuclease McrA